MAFEPAVIFPGILFEGAERVAKNAEPHSAETAPIIIQEMGWSSTLISEENGGYGGTFKDMGSLLEGMASRAINLPIITRCCVVPGMLSAAPRTDAIQRLLSQVADGTACVELAGPLTWRENHTMPQVSRNGDGWALNGELDAIELTSDCTHVLLGAINTENQEAVIVIVDAQQLLAPSREFSTVERRNIKSVAMHALALPDTSILAEGDAALAMQSAGWKLAQAAVGADIVCTMNYALAETVNYLQERKQFGQPLAQFQVLRHDVAKLYVSFETCKSLLMSSLRSLEPSAGDSNGMAAFDLLGLYVREQAIEFAQSVIQLHGGMGMAQETLAARMATRLIANAFRFGDAYSHTKALGDFQREASK